MATPATVELCADSGFASARCAPLGVPLLVQADTAGQLDLVTNMLRGWEGEEQSPGRALRLDLREVATLCDPGDIRLGLDGKRLILEGPGVAGWADPIAGRAECHLGRFHREDRKCVRDAVLEPLLLFLLAHNGRVPVHAGGFETEGMAVLLAGPSGAGKSCLALAAAQAGYRLVSDDTVYVQMRPTLRLWGIAGPVHVFPEDAPVGSSAPLRLRNGKLKQAVAMAAQDRATTAERAALCVLTHGGTAALSPIPAERACAMLHHVEPGFDLLAGEVRSAHAALAANGAWLLRLGPDPADAIRLITAELGRLRATAAP